MGYLFIILINPVCLNCYSLPVSVRLRHLDPNVKFKGYLIQARKYDSFNYIAQGRMKGPNTSFRPICGTTGVSIINSYSVDKIREDLSERYITFSGLFNHENTSTYMNKVSLTHLTIKLNIENMIL